jgi:hypothetical protein
MGDQKSPLYSVYITVQFLFEISTMYKLKQDLASVFGAAKTGNRVAINRHNKPVARSTRPEMVHWHIPWVRSEGETQETCDA